MYSIMRFPSRFQKFVRAPAEWLCEKLVQVLGEIYKKNEGEFIFKSSINSGTGVTLKARLIPEGDFSLIEFIFGYRMFTLVILVVLIFFVGLSVASSSLFPLIGLIIIPLLAHRASSKIDGFLEEISKILVGLEGEYARKRLAEERAKWQSSPKDVGELYRRLCEKHIKIWGNTYALEYKISEYQRQGLTRDEAIRKTADEEGIF
ncbi:MAG: hypothetical protein QW592_02140 [Candidatus Bathyarchaeia archaeon]